MLGSADPRSDSLRAVLNIGFLMRCPLFLLECVVEASSNRHVLEELKTFCSQCGFHFSDVTLRLQEVWPARRDRWWIVLSAQSLGKVPLQTFPWISPQRVIKHVLPRPLCISEEDRKQLVLEGQELYRFLQFQPDLSSMYLPLGGLCPTLLHSLGSQTVGCMCGCRNVGFSDATLAKGLFGILIPTGDTIQVGDHTLQVARHPHPDEAAILSAIPIPEKWPCPLRVALAGIGQQANPIQALWIASQIVSHLDIVIEGATNFSPRQVLEDFINTMVQQALARGEHSLVSQSVRTPCDVVEGSAKSGEHASLVASELVGREQANHEDPVVMIVDPNTSKVTGVKLRSPDCTVGQLITAEAQLAPQPVLVEVVDFLTKEPLGDQELLVNRHVQVVSLPLDILHAESDDMELENTHQECISPTLEFEIDDGHGTNHDGGDPLPLSDTDMVDTLDIRGRPNDPLLLLQRDQLVDMQKPPIDSLYTLQSYRTQTMHSKVRATLLWQQEQSWADDEILWHLQQSVGRSGKQGVVVMDPLLASAAVHDFRPQLIHDWYASLDGKPNMIVTAVCVDGHWSPFAWTWVGDSLAANSWDMPKLIPQAKWLHDALAKAVGARTFLVRTHHRTDNAIQACGVCAVRYIDHLLNGRMLPDSTFEVNHLNEVGRSLFKQYLCDQEWVCRPWTWGNGLDPKVHQRLFDLFQQHGVPHESIESRIQVTTLAIGIPALQKAILGSAPWRSLKALANQCQPRVQLVLPDELKAVVDAKAASGLGNSKKKRVQSDMKQPAKPVPLDPSKLAFDHGAFVTEHGVPVQQLEVTQLGPLVEGVAIAVFSDVEPFLRANQVVSKGGLAIFLLNTEEASMTTKLLWAECRVALRCIANGEPMLVNGYLAQLGHTIVSQARAKHVIELPDVPTACVKVSVYRDCTTVDWEQVISGPVKHVLQQLEVLQTCNVEGCNCPKWHAGTHAKIQEPVFDIWRRQWLNLSMKNTPPVRADVFLVNIRYAGVLEGKLLASSGHQGMFLEPRSPDAKEPILDYQVLWLAKHSLTNIMHICQCHPGTVGVARLGSRLGIRIKTEDIGTIGKSIKPEGVLLSGGPKQAFEIGPVPFGVDRTGLSQLCEEWGWLAKPVHPTRSVHGLGTVWVVHACTEPPSSIFSIKGKHDVVINKLPMKETKAAPQATAVGSSTTIGLCALQKHQDVQSDPWLVKDPWSASAGKLATGKPLKFDMDAGLQKVEERIEKAIMAKLPVTRQDMEIDGCSSGADSATSTRLQALEAQVQQIASSHHKLEIRVEETAKKSDAQISQLQHHMSAQLEGQGAKIEDLFRGQMAQLEALLAKKPRYE